VQVVYEGTDRIVGFSFIVAPSAESVLNSLNWLVVTHQDVTEALAPVRQQTRGVLVVSVLIIVLATASAAGLAQLLVVPITRLAQVADRVGAGDLSARAEVLVGDEVGRLASSFNSMTSQLQSTLQSLEQRVAERTRSLETATEVSRRISTILDQRQLVREVVDQVQSSFDYYHAHIYLFDEKKEFLLMLGGTGDAGQMMLDRDHKILRGRGLVGRAAETNLPALAPDVSKAEGWLPNPLLPETRSEVAVPIAIGDTVLGVLDVQDDVVNRMGQTDVDLLQAIANQVAIAIQNARAYQQAQRQADREALIGNINQRIQNTGTIEDAIKVAVREVGRALGTGAWIKVQPPASLDRK
jgi:nitrate/nitrite-specific signal transduction histidine kinase